MCIRDSVSIAFVEPNFPGSQNVNLVDTASNATSYSWSTSTNSGGNWLLANNAFSGATPQNLAAVYGAYIPISLNPAVAGNLPSGAYSGAVVVTSISGSSATIDVNPVSYTHLLGIGGVGGNYAGESGKQGRSGKSSCVHTSQDGPLSSLLAPRSGRDGHLLHHLDAETLQRHDFAGMVGEQADGV